MTGLQHTRERLRSSAMDTGRGQAAERWESQHGDRSAAHQVEAKQRRCERPAGHKNEAEQSCTEVEGKQQRSRRRRAAAKWEACSTQGRGCAAALRVQADGRPAIWLSSRASGIMPSEQCSPDHL